MTEKEQQALREFAAALENPEIRAFADGYKAGRAARLQNRRPGKEDEQHQATA